MTVSVGYPGIRIPGTALAGRKKKGEKKPEILVIPFLYLETMGVNG